MIIFRYEVPNTQGQLRLDRVVSNHVGNDWSRSTVQSVIKEHGVNVNGNMVYITKHLIEPGDMIEVQMPEIKPFEICAENIDLDIIYEDDAFLAVNKPVGMVVHPGAGNHSGTLVNALIGAGVSLAEVDDAHRPGIVHRLDKETSGLLLVAKTKSAHQKLADALASRSIQKEYVALVGGRIDFLEGQIEAAIARDPVHRTKMKVSDTEKAREALTKYRIIERFKYSTLVRVFPHTGRTHQIRVHFAHIQHPVLGDFVYGNKHAKCLRMALHAARLEFLHPIDGTPLVLEAPLPKEFEQMIEIEKART
ncbi:MAG: 23S rRNA pseudouridine1911/1915/1917 synthase [Candidatus Omnitrophota bacterium]|jgi:23S rRNA pseudouridine1911/1915/1917 synthase